MSKFEALVTRWRKEAKELASLNRSGCYPDQSARVRQHMTLTTLRRCADALQMQIKKHIAACSECGAENGYHRTNCLRHPRFTAMSTD